MRRWTRMLIMRRLMIRFMSLRDTYELYSVACSPTDPFLVATGGKDDRGFMWKVGSQDSVLEFQGYGNTISTLAFSSDGQFLATGSFDGVIRVWDASLGGIKCNLEGSGGGVEWLKWHPKGYLILAGSKASSVHMVKLATGRVISSLLSHSKSVECVGVSPNTHWAATGSLDEKLIIWDLERSSLRCTCEHELHSAVIEMRFVRALRACTGEHSCE